MLIALKSVKPLGLQANDGRCVGLETTNVVGDLCRPVEPWLSQDLYTNAVQ
jgi:hypothetical protein